MALSQRKTPSLTEASGDEATVGMKKPENLTIFEHKTSKLLLAR